MQNRSKAVALAEFRRGRGYLLFGLAKVEQCNVTLPQTESILNGVVGAGIKTADVEVILNLKRAHGFLTDELNLENFELNLENLCKLHAKVAANEALEWGNVRGDGKEKNYTPGVRLEDGRLVKPTETSSPEKIKVELIEVLEKFSNSKKEVDSGIELFCDLTRIQAFFDGNKRTSLLFANAALVAEGIKPISIPSDKMEDFNKAVGHIFENDKAPMMKLLSEEYERAYPNELKKEVTEEKGK